MTTVGVACRGGIPLNDVFVELGVEPEAGESGGFSVHERVVFKGDMDDAQRQRLDRTTDYCPVGQLFGKGTVSIEDRLEYHEPSERVVSGQPAPDNHAVANLVATGTIRACYLPETKVWSAHAGARVLEHEGEVKLYFDCGSAEAPRRWVMLSGHTLSWNPIPMHLATGGLAGSSVSTLQQALAPKKLTPGDLRIVVEMARGSGGRHNAQAAAVNGVVRTYQIVRRVLLGDALQGVSRTAVHEALEKDPLTRYFCDGNLPLKKELVFSK